MARYMVLSSSAYREHPKGRIFEADLDPAAEQRAIERGDIALLQASRTGLLPGSYRLPVGWHLRKQALQKE